MKKYTNVCPGIVMKTVIWLEITFVIADAAVGIQVQCLSNSSVNIFKIAIVPVLLLIAQTETTNAQMEFVLAAILSVLLLMNNVFLFRQMALVFVKACAVHALKIKYAMETIVHLGLVIPTFTLMANNVTAGAEVMIQVVFPENFD